MDYRRGESVTLSNLGLTYFYLGESQTGQDYCRQGLSLAQMMGIRPTQGQALTCLGHVLRGMGQLAEAAEIYRQAISLRHELDQPHLALDPQAGLAQTLLDQGEPAQAQAVTEGVLNRLASFQLEKSLAGADDPGQILMTCYQVLQANHDSRAPGLFRSAHQFLQSRADKIGQKDRRRFFLERMTTHQGTEQLIEPP
jgi:tetratricopeptide (TPR) repeat protein